MKAPQTITDLSQWLSPLFMDQGDDLTSEVLINGPNEVWVERAGQLERTEHHFADAAELDLLVRRTVAATGRKVDHLNPVADCRLPDGSRMSVVLPPLAVGGTCVAIRRFPQLPPTLATLMAAGLCSVETMNLLSTAIQDRQTMLISGPTGSGKTTLLGALLNFVPTQQRIITIEDVAEISLEHPHHVRLESRPANLEGQGAVSIRDLLRAALRLRPDRLIVGECRGDEALDLLQALNTGHSGSLSTVHANSCREALSRLELLCALGGEGLSLPVVRRFVAGAINMVVQLQRLADGRRVISEVAQVRGMEGEAVVLRNLYSRSSRKNLSAIAASI